MAFARTRSEQEVFTLTKDATALEAARLFAERHVGAVIIIEGGHPIGIVTDRDLAVRVIAARLDADATPLERVMTRDPIVARDDLAPADIAGLMAEHGVRRIPLVRPDGKLSGILTLDDLLALSAYGISSLAGAIARSGRRETRELARPRTE